MVKKFSRCKEDFVCENCGEKVSGDGYTNHCPVCLCSKHVDINPGDRQNECMGLMETIEVEEKGKEYIITHHFKLSGNLEKISAMVIGNLSKCRDEKNESNNRPIEEIVLELTKGYNFPIIKVPYFGHDTSDFYTLPIGAVAEIDTTRKEFKIIESPVQ